MLEVRASSVFDDWFVALRDRQAQARIQARVRRLSMGNPGDQRNLAGGIAEMRIDYGPGYRVYYCVRGQTVCLLLCGGDKRSQQADIEQAQALLQELKQQEKSDEKTSDDP